jgi:DNA-binding PadR family transcriptional regulator
VVRGEETRLFLLAELDRRGEAHGHELRREAQIGRSELWSAVRVGSIYSTLKRLEAEDLIAAVRDERPGRMPQRTIYTITAEGRRELKRLRGTALREVHIPADPFDLAWSYTAEIPTDTLADTLADRLRELDGRARSLEHQRQTAATYLDERDHQLFDHLAARIRTEIGFHKQLRATLTEHNTSQGDRP